MKFPLIQLALLLLFVSLLDCFSAQAAKKPKQLALKADTVLSIRTGTASYYAAKFQGRHTSNGERLDNNAYICASSRLPYDTWVRVTNLRNSKSVVVRVTDRFAPGGTHLVDLTLRAAQDIDMVRYGIVRVRMEVLNPDFIRTLLPQDTITVPISSPRTHLYLPIKFPNEQRVNLIR